MNSPTRRRPAPDAPTSSNAHKTADQSDHQHYDTRAGSLAYTTAGDLARIAIGSAVIAKLSTLDLRVFLVFVHKTATYSKGADRTSSRDIASVVYGVARDDVQGWQRRNVVASLRHLTAAGVIVYEPGIGRSARAYIGFPQSASTDKPSAAKGASTESPSTDKGDRAQHERGSGSALKGIGIAATPRNHPEKSAEPERTSADIPPVRLADRMHAYYGKVKNVDRAEVDAMLAVLDHRHLEQAFTEAQATGQRFPSWIQRRVGELAAEARPSPAYHDELVRRPCCGEFYFDCFCSEGAA